MKDSKEKELFKATRNQSENAHNQSSYNCNYWLDINNSLIEHYKRL